MKIIFNTRVPDLPASQFYLEGFQLNTEVKFFDYNNYEKYDFALFMSYKEDWNDIKEAKRINSKLKIGVCDPRGTSIKKIVHLVDFFLVDSIEMYDFFQSFNIPIFIYPDIPKLPIIEKEHKKKDKIIIGYHGNLLHLRSIFPHITQALDYLSDKYNIELWVVYNIKNGKWDFALPKKCKVRHIQWHKNVYIQELKNVDIGICPSLMPLRNINFIKKISTKWGMFSENKDDYLIRFKMPSNEGRAAVFGHLGIPVIVDLLPANLQLVQYNWNGLIAYSSQGWYRALEKLIINHEFRNLLSSNMTLKIREKYDFVKINKDFNEFLNSFDDNKYTPIMFENLLLYKAKFNLQLIKTRLIKIFKSIIKFILNLHKK